MRREFVLVPGVILGSLALIAGLGFFGARPAKSIEDVTAACVQHRGIGIHIHARLTLRIDGQERTIPADIGVENPRCMRPLHTHDDSGTLHLEFPTAQEVRLGQFFDVWGQPFTRTQVLDRKVGDGDVLRVTVNGQDTQELEGLILHDRDDVVIEITKNE